MPEDDMRERFEEMARMREHVFGELDHDKDHFISLDEFLNYTASQEFEKDEGWKVYIFGCSGCRFDNQRRTKASLSVKPLA